MRIAIPVVSSESSAMLETRFGRAQCFALFDEEKSSWEFENHALDYQAVQGAGIQAAQKLVNLKVDVVLTSHCGPKAFRVLQAANVKVYFVEMKTALELREDYRNGKCTLAQEADVEGHHV